MRIVPASSLHPVAPRQTSRFGMAQVSSKRQQAEPDTKYRWGDFSFDQALDTGNRLKRNPRELAALQNAIPTLTVRQKRHMASGIKAFRFREAQTPLLSSLLQDDNPAVLKTAISRIGHLARPSVDSERAWFKPIGFKPFLHRPDWVNNLPFVNPPVEPHYLIKGKPQVKFYEAHHPADEDTLDLLEKAAQNPQVLQGDQANTLRQKLVPQILKLQTTRLTSVPRANNGNIYYTEKQMTEALTRQVNLMVALPYSGQPGRIGKLLGHKPYSHYVQKLAEQVQHSPINNTVKDKLGETLSQALNA